MKILSILILSLLASTSQAGIIQIDETNFNAGAGVITFSEFALNTVNPTYTPTDYGGAPTDPTVTFDGYFSGQALSSNPGVDCPGAAATACVSGSPTNPLSLDPSSPNTFITTDGSNPTSPVLSGTPTFNGPIAVLFSSDQFGVGFDAGFFDGIGSTAITAFARDGSLIGSVSNSILGIEFLGLVTDDNTASIAGVFLDLISNEPAGFAIDNIRFGGVADVDVGPIPEPTSLALLGFGLLGFNLLKKRKA